MNDEDVEKPALVEEMGMLDGHEGGRGPYAPSSLEELRELLRSIEQK